MPKTAAGSKLFSLCLQSFFLFVAGDVLSSVAKTIAVGVCSRRGLRGGKKRKVSALKIIVEAIEVVVGRRRNNFQETVGIGGISPLLNQDAAQSRRGIAGHADRPR